MSELQELHASIARGAVADACYGGDKQRWIDIYMNKTMDDTDAFRAAMLAVESYRSWQERNPANPISVRSIHP